MFLYLSKSLRVLSYCHTVIGFVLLLTDYGAAPGLVNHILQSCLSAAQFKERLAQVQNLKMNSSILWNAYTNLQALIHSVIITLAKGSSQTEIILFFLLSYIYVCIPTHSVLFPQHNTLFSSRINYVGVN